MHRSPANRIRQNVIHWLALILGVGIVALWATIYSHVLVGCLLLVLIAVRIDRARWSRRIESDELSTGQVVLTDCPASSLPMLAFEGFAVLFAGLVASQIPLARDELYGLTLIQWILIIASFWFWFLFWRLYTPVRYTVTSQGIWIQDCVLTVFIPFDDLEKAELIGTRLSWKGHQTHITRFSKLVLLKMTKQSWPRRNILLSPRNLGEFLSHLPSHLVESKNNP